MLEAKSELELQRHLPPSARCSGNSEWSVLANALSADLKCVSNEDHGSFPVLLGAFLLVFEIQQGLL